MSWLNVFETVTVPGLRFNIGDTVWFMHKNEVKSGKVSARAWCEGGLPCWWDEHRGETYWVGQLKLTEVYATKAELLATL